MNARWTALLAACAAVLLCGSLLATAAEPTIGQNQSAVQGSAGVIQNSTLMGATVLDPQGQKLGQVKDVLLDSQTGQATFAVLDAEVPGSGHAMLVVPYQALWVSFNPLDHRQSVALNLRQDQLRAAPQIQNNQWQMLQNPKFLEQARNFYQIRTVSAARPVDNPSTPCPPIPCVVPQPRRCAVSQPREDPYAGWPQSLIDFYNE